MRLSRPFRAALGLAAGGVWAPRSKRPAHQLVHRQREHPEDAPRTICRQVTIREGRSWPTPHDSSEGTHHETIDLSLGRNGRAGTIAIP